MKKLLLLTTTGLLSLGASAQFAHPSMVTKPMDHRSNGLAYTNNVIAKSNPSFLNNAKVTGTVFQTETFGTGTPTTPPTGWTSTGVSGSWKWRNVACTGQFNIGTINSTTKADGWMVYDSDSIGDKNPGVTPIEGFLTSPTYNCTGHATVQVTFQEWFRKFQDSCFVEVSNNGGTSWTVFPVLVNNGLAANSNVPTNATKIRINISSVAANQANVKVRFHYKGMYAGGSYNWLVDDMTLEEMDPVDVAVSGSAMILYGGTNIGFTSFGTIPKTFVDTLFPFTLLTNYGSTAPTNVNVNAKIFQGTNATPVYDSTVVYTTLPVNAIDSIVDFTTKPGYKPTATGNYTIAYNATATGDAVPDNNIDTARFSVSDSIWAQNVGNITGGYYVHRPASSGEMSFYSGAIFRVPAGKTDTITAASVGFSSGTTAGSKVSVQFYKFDGGWATLGTTEAKTLAASDLPVAGGSQVYAYFHADVSGGIESLILDGGANGMTYAAVVQGDGIPSTSTVVVNASKAPGNADVTSIFGVSDTSNNDGQFTFAQGGLPSGLATVPLVRLHFGDASHLSVGDVFANVAGVTAYPNPADKSVSVPVTMAKEATVEVSLINMLGQTVKVQQLGKVGANQTATAVFSTNNLAEGVYIFSVNANGQRKTGRIVVAH